MRAHVFIISLIIEGVKCYFVRFESAPYILMNKKIMDNSPQGIFSQDVCKAYKYKDRSQAEQVSSLFDGSQVEILKEGEKLK